MIRLVRLALIAALASLALTAGAQARTPACMVAQPDFPQDQGGYVTGSFTGTCSTPVLKQGVFACLEERLTVDGPITRTIECWANDQIIKAGTTWPHSVSVSFRAACAYTSKPHYYSLFGYGWVVADGVRYTTPRLYSSPYQLLGTRFCAIGGAADVVWSVSP